MNARIHSLLVIGTVLAFIVRVDGQNAKNVATIGRKAIDREFLVGRAVAFAVGSCSFVAGNVTSVEPSPQGYKAGSLALKAGSLALEVRERVGSFKVADVDGLLDVPYKQPVKPEDKYQFGYHPYIWLDDPKPGEALGLFICPRNFSYSTTDETEFASIRRSVEHSLQFKKRPEIILDVPRIIENEPDRIFATYLAMFVATYRTVAYPDHTLRVLSQLMENDIFFSSYDGKSRQRLGIQMVQILSLLIEVNRVFVAKPETKEDSLGRVIKVAGSQRPFTPFALRIIARIKADGSVDLDRYLDETTRTKLRRSYSRFTVKELGHDDHALLGRLLAAGS